MTIKINDEILLESLDVNHAREMFDLIDSNRDHLREWLPWVDPMRSIEKLQNHIAYCKQNETAGTDYPFAIKFNGKIAGRIGIHYIHHHNKIASLGYWLGDGYQGKGIMIKSCIALINYCFNELGMNRVEIKCATGNTKSAAIAEKLNFKKEGILRQAEFVNDRFLDLYLYAMLKDEWKKL